MLLYTIFGDNGSVGINATASPKLSGFLIFLQILKILNVFKKSPNVWRPYWQYFFSPNMYVE